jgi:hypothetical protein
MPNVTHASAIGVKIFIVDLILRNLVELESMCRTIQLARAREVARDLPTRITATASGCVFVMYAIDDQEHDYDITSEVRLIFANNIRKTSFAQSFAPKNAPSVFVRRSVVPECRVGR